MNYSDIPRLPIWQGDTYALRNPLSAQLKALDDDIEKYHQAYSPMAKKNLINDLKIKFKAWEQANLAQTKNFAAVALKDIIAKKHDDNLTDHNYTDAICIAWAVPCSTNKGNYYRTSKNDRIDMTNKCLDMKRAINAALGNFPNTIADNDQTLKIFMAPEFYFRGVHGAYSPDLVSEIIPTMMKNEDNLKGTGHSDFKNWIFVFGTAVSAMETSATVCQQCGEDAVEFIKQANGKTIAQCKNDPTHTILQGTYGAEIHNVALIQKGQEKYLITKEFTSGIDYKHTQGGAQFGKVWVHPNTPNIKLLNVVPPQGSADSHIVSKFDDERMGGCVFTVDNITFGLEICLDHIASATPNQGRLASYSDSIQIHLIPSFGMNIGNKMYCKANGLVFNVDGRPNVPAEVRIKGAAGASNSIPVNSGTRGGLQFFGPFNIPA